MALCVCFGATPVVLTFGVFKVRDVCDVHTQWLCSGGLSRVVSMGWVCVGVGFEVVPLC